MTVELMTAGLFVLMLHRGLGLNQEPSYTLLELLTTCLFAGLLVAISFIDLDFTIIPNRIVYTGLLIGLLLAIFASIVRSEINLILSRMLGAVIGAGITLLIAIIGSIAFRKEAMGFGDLKLFACIGAFLGWLNAVYVLMAASIVGAVIGSGQLLWNKLRALLEKQASADRQVMHQRLHPLPFGPYIAFSAVIILVFQKRIPAFAELLLRTMDQIYMRLLGL